jgi:hypothetical protein
MNYLGNSIFGIFSYLNINNLLSKLLSYIRTATPNHLNNHINDEKNITLFPIEPVPLEETPLFQQQDLEHLMKELKDLDEINTFVVSKIMRNMSSSQLNYELL